MKAVIVEKIGGEMKVADLPVPEPGDGQILVRSIFTAINPVDAIMIQTGVLVVEWPMTPGCDAGGVVVKAGANAMSPLGGQFKEGDRVIGCTRLGSNGYSPYAEYFLMDAQVTLPLPDNLTLAEGCTLGVATYTAALGVFKELRIPLPNPAQLPSPSQDWAVVFGGASSVGKAAIQILKSVGYKVVATGSQASFNVIKAVGADEVVDYKQAEESVIQEIIDKTGGKPFTVFDATAQNVQTSVPLFKAAADGTKIFTSTNDWTPVETGGAFEFSPISCGPVGRPSSTVTNESLHAAIPIIYALLAAGKVTPSEYVQIGETGVESVLEGFSFQVAGKGGNKKVIVRIAPTEA